MDLQLVTRQELEEMEARMIAAFKSILNALPGNAEKLYNTASACAYLNVCTKTLQNYRDAGLIKYTQVGRKIMYTQESMDAFLKSYQKSLFNKEIIDL